MFFSHLQLHFSQVQCDLYSIKKAYPSAACIDVDWGLSQLPFQFRPSLLRSIFIAVLLKISWSAIISNCSVLISPLFYLSSLLISLSDRYAWNLYMLNEPILYITLFLSLLIKLSIITSDITQAFFISYQSSL